MKESGSHKLSRRSFLKGTVAVAGVTALSGLAACDNNTDDANIPGGSSNIVWDYEYDVIIPGMGAAGLAAAITCTNMNPEQKVLLFDKASEEHAGGNSRVAMNAFWSGCESAQMTKDYLIDITDPYHSFGQDEAYFERHAKYFFGLGDWYTENVPTCPLMEFPHAEYPHSPYAVGSHSYTAAAGFGFQRVWIGLMDTVATMPNVEVRYLLRFTDLLFNSDGEVIGIQAVEDAKNFEADGTLIPMAKETGKVVNIKASRGVIICVGGYENNDEMKSNYLRRSGEDACGYCGTPYNTGDGHLIAINSGLKMWHMNMATQATFKGPIIPWVEDSVKFNIGLGCEIASDPGFIYVDTREAQRFVDETSGGEHGFADDTWHWFDAKNILFPYLPWWMVFDKQALEKGRIGQYSSYDQWVSMISGFTFSKDMELEVEKGLCFKADTIEDLARQIDLDPEALKKTIERYNSFVDNGVDEDFGRQMKPVEALGTGGQTTGGARKLEAPFYAIKQWPLMVNTQGGPQHNANRQLMKAGDDSLVPRLYAAGEFGSMWGWCYQGGANVGECLISGQMAGEAVSSIAAWDAVG